MVSPIQEDILRRLAEVSELSEEVRFGQLLDFLGFLASAKANQSLAEIEDTELLEIIGQHCAALRMRKPEALARRA